MSTVPTETRVCIDCKIAKPFSEFYEKSGGNLYSRCKSCHYERTKKQRAADPARFAKYARDAYHRDPQKALAKKAKWYADNPERVKEMLRRSSDKRREQKKAYRDANAERIKAKNAEWRAKNQQKIKARNFIYNRENREAISERVKKCIDAKPVLYHQLRKAAKHRRKVRLVNQGPHEKFTDLEIFERDNWICQLCGEKVDRTLKYPDPGYATLDHVIPIAKGGGHTRVNSQLAHLGCNSSKRDRSTTLF